MTTVALPMPATLPPDPPAMVAPRRPCRQVMVGSVPVGGDAPVSVQSMTTTPTADVNATLQQIAELTAAGCQIVRVAVPSQDDAEALPLIARKSQIPVIADIHFQPKYVFAAIDAGCAAVRVNPGNIRAFDNRVGEIAKAAGAAGIPIRIGVNAGSLDRRLLAKHGGATAAALAESALWEASLFEEHGFTDLKISVKHHDPLVMIEAYRLLGGRLRLSASPRRHGSGTRAAGHRQVRCRFRNPAARRHRRHHQGLADRPAGGGGHRRPADSRVARAAATRPGDRLLPVLRAGPG